MLLFERNFLFYRKFVQKTEGRKDVCVEPHSSLSIFFSKTCTIKDLDHLNPLKKDGHDARLKNAQLYLGKKR